MAEQVKIVLTDQGPEAGTSTNPFFVGLATSTAAFGVAPATTASFTNQAATVASIAFQAANTSRKMLIVFNDSPGSVYIKTGSGASATSFSIKMEASDYFELPAPVYTGVMHAAWSTTSGSLRVTELS